MFSLPTHANILLFQSGHSKEPFQNVIRKLHHYPNPSLYFSTDQLTPNSSKRANVISPDQSQAGYASSWQPYDASRCQLSDASSFQRFGAWGSFSGFWCPGLPSYHIRETLLRGRRVTEKCLDHGDAVAAKSVQLCLTLCNPTDGSLPGSPLPGILQARTLEWVAISFSNAWKWKVNVKSFSCVRRSAIPWTAAFQAPLSMGFSRQEYWSGLPLPSPGSCRYVVKNVKISWSYH